MAKIEFHFLEGSKMEPACGASKASHATKNVESYPQCPKCLKLLLERAQAKKV